jgi:hypothetical protein
MAPDDEALAADLHIPAISEEEAALVAAALTDADAAILTRTPSAAAVLETGSVTLLDKARAATLLANE